VPGSELRGALPSVGELSADTTMERCLRSSRYIHRKGEFQCNLPPSAPESPLGERHTDMLDRDGMQGACQELEKEKRPPGEPEKEPSENRVRSDGEEQMSERQDLSQSDATASPRNAPPARICQAVRCETPFRIAQLRTQRRLAQLRSPRRASSSICSSEGWTHGRQLSTFLS